MKAPAEKTHVKNFCNRLQKLDEDVNGQLFWQLPGAPYVTTTYGCGELGQPLDLQPHQLQLNMQL